MILVTHAIAGGAVASLVPNNPVLGFTLGFASHFLLDAIPHWDYPIRSLEKSKEKLKEINTESHGIINKVNNDIDFIERNWMFLFRDFIFVVLDVLAGLIVVFYFAQTKNQDFLTPFLGAFGGVLPDGILFLFFFTKHNSLKWMKDLQDFFHTKIKINNHIFGFLLQIVFIILILYILM